MIANETYLNVAIGVSLRKFRCQADLSEEQTVRAVQEQLPTFSLVCLQKYESGEWEIPEYVVEVLTKVLGFSWEYLAYFSRQASQSPNYLGFLQLHVQQLSQQQRDRAHRQSLKVVTE